MLAINFSLYSVYIILLSAVNHYTLPQCIIIAGPGSAINCINKFRTCLNFIPTLLIYLVHFIGAIFRGVKYVVVATAKGIKYIVLAMANGVKYIGYSIGAKARAVKNFAQRAIPKSPSKRGIIISSR